VIDVESMFKRCSNAGKWGPDDKYRWREHEGRGYWSPKGAWIEF